MTVEELKMEEQKTKKENQKMEKDDDSSDSNLSEDDSPVSTFVIPKKCSSTTILSEKEKTAARLKLKGVLLNLLEKNEGSASIEEVKMMYLEMNGEELDPVALVGKDWAEFLKEIKKDPLKITTVTRSNGTVCLSNPNFAYKKQMSVERKQETACERIVAVLKKNGGKASFEELCDFYKTEYDVELDPTERRRLSGVGGKADFCRFLKEHEEKVIVISRKKQWFLWTPEVYLATEGRKARRRRTTSLETETEEEHDYTSSQKTKKQRIRPRPPSISHSSSQDTLPRSSTNDSNSSSSQLDSTTGGSQESVVLGREERVRNARHVRVGVGKKRISQSCRPTTSKMPRLEREPPFDSRGLDDEPMSSAFNMAIKTAAHTVLAPILEAQRVEEGVLTEGIEEKAIEPRKEVRIARQEKGLEGIEAIEKDLFEPTDESMDLGEVATTVVRAQNPVPEKLQGPETNNTVAHPDPSVKEEKPFIHAVKTSVSSEAASTTSDPAKPPTGFAVDQTPVLVQVKQEIPDTPTSSIDVKPSLMAQSPQTRGVSKYAHFGNLFVIILDQADRNGEDVNAIVLRTFNALYGK